MLFSIFAVARVITLKFKHPSAGFMLKLTTKRDTAYFFPTSTCSASWFSNHHLIDTASDQKYIPSVTAWRETAEDGKGEFSVVKPKFVSKYLQCICYKHVETFGGTCRSATGAVTIAHMASLRAPSLKARKQQSSNKSNKPFTTYTLRKRCHRIEKRQNGGTSPGARRGSGDTADPGPPTPKSAACNSGPPPPPPSPSAGGSAHLCSRGSRGSSSPGSSCLAPVSAAAVGPCPPLQRCPPAAEAPERSKVRARCSVAAGEEAAVGGVAAGGSPAPRQHAWGCPARRRRGPLRRRRRSPLPPASAWPWRGRRARCRWAPRAWG